MKIPTSFKIKGKKWRICHKWNLLDDDGTHVDGLCCVKKRIVYLDRSLVKEDKQSTLLHELFHALIYEIGLHQTSLTLDVEELIVENLSLFMLETFNIRLKR
jgi:Zn-dependent peptidase ImmA (M78 family)